VTGCDLFESKRKVRRLSSLFNISTSFRQVLLSNIRSVIGCFKVCVNFHCLSQLSLPSTSFQKIILDHTQSKFYDLHDWWRLSSLLVASLQPYISQISGGARSVCRPSTVAVKLKRHLHCSLSRSSWFVCCLSWLHAWTRLILCHGYSNVLMHFVDEHISNRWR
jgi:hypothetical protein